jgi:hypothetical protein
MSRTNRRVAISDATSPDPERKNESQTMRFGIVAESGGSCEEIEKRILYHFIFWRASGSEAAGRWEMGNRKPETGKRRPETGNRRLEKRACHAVALRAKAGQQTTGFSLRLGVFA